jgi:hypothetical protein
VKNARRLEWDLGCETKGRVRQSVEHGEQSSSETDRFLGSGSFRRCVDRLGEKSRNVARDPVRRLCVEETSEIGGEPIVG